MKRVLFTLFLLVGCYLEHRARAAARSAAAELTALELPRAFAGYHRILQDPSHWA